MDAGGGGKAGVKSDINVTPLVDIVLVLLIIFIVITPAVNDAVKLPLSKYSEKPVTDQGVKYLTLMMPSKRDAKTGQVIGSKPVLIDDPQKKPEEQAGFKIMDEAGNPNEAGRTKLVAFIKNSTMYLSDKRVFVKADADLPFKYVNELFQLCREGGADEASVVTSEDKSGEKKK